MEDSNIMGVGVEIPKGAFVGHYTHSLDPKKRLTIPAEWRELSGAQQLFVLPGMDQKCLCVYPASEIARRLERLRTLSIADERGRQFARALGSRSALVSCDSQGRLRIKDHQLAYAGLVNQVEMVGAVNIFELWNPDAWKAQDEMMSDPIMKDIAVQIGF